MKLSQKRLGQVPLLAYPAIWITLLVGTFLSFMVFRITSDREDRTIRAQFDRHIAERVAALEEEIGLNLEILLSLKDLYAASEYVSEDEFSKFTGPAIERHPGVQSLQWVPRVPVHERDPFEKRVRAEGESDFRIRRPESPPEAPGYRPLPDYFPVLYVEPFEQRKALRGLDLGAVPQLQVEMERSRDMGRIRATPRVPLGQTSRDEGPHTFVIFVPIYSGTASTLMDRRDRLEGYIVGVLQIPVLIENAISKVSREGLGIEMTLFDETASEEHRLLYRHKPRTGGEAVSVYANYTTLAVADRTWSIVSMPTDRYLETRRTWQPYGYLVLGFSLTFFLTVYLHREATRKRRIDRLVRVRTSELAASEARIKAIVENVVDGIITIDEAGKIESINPAVEKLFGYRGSDLIGKNVSILMPEPHSSHHDQYIRNYLETGSAKIIGVGRELEAKHRSGKIFPIELGISEVWVEDRRLFAGVIRDISERKAVDRMKNEFISTISHELRTPLTSIRGSLGLIVGGAAGEIPEKIRSLLEIASKNCERLVRLINDILDIEKIEAGKMSFEMKPLELNALVRQAIAANEGLGKPLGVRFEFREMPTEIMVTGDTDRLTQVMTNLLSNAVKFSPEKASVEVAVAMKDGRVQVSVSDHGSGIPEEFRDRIFQKFAQADSSDTRRKGGTGLGLNICKAIVEKHGGQIDFVSSPGAGTTFHFDLPEYHELSTVAAQVVEPRDDRLRILVCEDDPDVARLIGMMLAQGDMDVEVAGSAQAAKEMLSKSRYDAMTLDLNLPGQDGVSLIRELRESESTRDLPIVVISGRAQEGKSEFKGGAVGIVDWLDKPIDQDRLINVMKSTFEGRQGDKPQILHVEDDPDVAQVVAALVGEEAEILRADSVEGARRLLAGGRFDLIILDIGLPDGSGLDLVPMIKNLLPQVPIILFSSYDVNPEMAGIVSGVLVKSQTSNDKLLATIKGVIRKAN